MDQGLPRNITASLQPICFAVSPDPHPGTHFRANWTCLGNVRVGMLCTLGAETGMESGKNYQKQG